MRTQSNTIKTQNDIENDLEALLELDPRLVPIAKIAGEIPLRKQADGFKGLTRVIIGQHVSTASAGAISERFYQEISPVTPSAFLAAGEDAWVKIGLTRAKQATITTLANAILNKELELDEIAQLPAKEAIEHLTALKGIGPWTAEVYLLFSVGHRDLFAAGDLAVREAVRMAFDLAERPSEKELRQIAEGWAPLRGIATRLFWSYYESIKSNKNALL